MATVRIKLGAKPKDGDKNTYTVEVRDPSAKRWGADRLSSGGGSSASEPPAAGQ